MKRILIFIFICYGTLFADASVWKVQKDNEVVYLGGTLHLLRSQDYPLPQAYDSAYAKADRLFFEVNLTSLDPAVVQKKMINAMLLNNGETLSQLLSSSTYEQLSKVASQYGLPLKNFEPFRPGMVVLNLTIAEFQKLGLSIEGVDKYYQAKSIQEGKPTLALESIDEQFSYFASMGEGNEDNFIQQSLIDLKKTKNVLLKMLSAWRAGNEKQMNELFITDMKRDYPKLYQSILVERNNNWMPKIEQMFHEEGVEFVLVGAAHLVGDDGLLAQLRALGYEVERLEE